MSVLKAKSGAGSVPSMQNVAAYAGVSIATVSKVMQGDATVRPENVTAVQNAIEALGYRINPLAAELRRGRRQLIGAIVPRYDALADALIASLERHAAERGYALWAASSDGFEHREGDLIHRFQDWRVAGLIVLPIQSESGASALLIRETTSSVFLESPGHAPFSDTVSTEWESASRAALDRLDALGHRHIAVMAQASDAGLPVSLKATLAAASASAPSVKLSFLDLSLSPPEAASEIHALLQISDRPTAIIALEPGLLPSVVAYAAGCGWAVPSDLSIVAMGVGNVEFTASQYAALQYPTETVAARVIAALVGRLAHPAAPPSALVEQGKFKIGSTIGSTIGAVPQPTPLRSRA